MEHFGFPPLTMFVFSTLVIGGIALDLYRHKANEKISLQDAALWSIFWVAVSVAFGLFLYFEYGSETASLFFTGYALEKVLSVDNLFVFMAIFTWFSIPDGYRHRILYWGIIGAIVFRLIFVAIGSSLLMFGTWVEIIFGLVVGYTAYLMLKKSEESEEIENYSDHIAYRYTHKWFNVSPDLHGQNFFVVKNGILWATPLFLCLAVIEVSDIMFAFDSVPAVIAVSKEPLIIYSAMIFAILGLRTMYFLLEALKDYFTYLENAVIIILFFIAGKLIWNSIMHMLSLTYIITPMFSLSFVLTMIVGSIILSIVKR